MNQQSRGPKIKIGSVFGRGTSSSTTASTQPPPPSGRPTAPPLSAPTLAPKWLPLCPPIQLHPGKTYFARLHLSGLEKTFASHANIAEKLEAVGFRLVCVWMNPAELAEFPSSTMPAGVLAKKGPFAAGVWAAAEQAAALPEQVVEVWERAS
jgi:hypothetical protein